MIRTRQVRLRLSKSQFHHCQQLSAESAKVWNAVKNFFWRTYRKKGIWLSESSLKRYVGSRFNLHSQTIQAVVEKFYTNLKASRVLRKENPDIRYPYKNKKWYCIHWKKQAIKVDGQYIHLSNGKGRQGIIFKLSEYLANCQPNTVELIWKSRSASPLCSERNGYWLSIVLEVEGKQQVLGFNTAAVDMGEIHAVTITDGDEATVISGRKLRSVKRYRNKTVGKLARKQSRCTKHSRKWKRLQAVKSRVIAECERRIRDLNHKITRITVDWCVEHNIGTLVIGDVTGIAQNTNKDKRLSRINRQKISQWSFYTQRQYLEYKCDEVGIEVVLESEKDTSKTCPKCGHQKKPTGRNYNCPACSLKIHRDVVGASNIRTKHLTGELKGNDNFNSPKVKYLRIDSLKLSKSSSGAGVTRRKRIRRKLGVSEQLTLFPEV